MRYGTLYNRGKNRRFKALAVLWVFIFTLQTNPVFCACLSGTSHAKEAMGASPGNMGCHGMAEQTSCCGGGSQGEPKDADSQADACPLCHCQLTGVKKALSTDLLTSSASHSAEQILLASGTSPVLRGASHQGDRCCLDPPQRDLPLRPIFMLNRSLLI